MADEVFRRGLMRIVFAVSSVWIVCATVFSGISIEEEAIEIESSATWVEITGKYVVSCMRNGDISKSCRDMANKLDEYIFDLKISAKSNRSGLLEILILLSIIYGMPFIFYAIARAIVWIKSGFSRQI